jgi:hypothetical protein
VYLQKILAESFAAYKNKTKKVGRKLCELGRTRPVSLDSGPENAGFNLESAHFAV